MAINVRFEGEITVLSNFGRLLNDPRHFDASRDVKSLLDEGHRLFVLDLGEIREIGETGIGLLTTLTRQIRREGGETVLARLRPHVVSFLERMRMDSYWDWFGNIEDAAVFLRRSPS